MLGSLKVVVEFLFIDTVFSGKQLCQAGFSHLEIGSLATAHIVDTVFDDILLDEFFGFDLPVGLVSQVVMAADIIILFRKFEFSFATGHDMSIRAELLCSRHISFD